MSAKGPWRTTYPKIPCTAMYSNPGPKYAVGSGLMSASTNKDKNDTLYQSPAYTIGTAYSKNIDKTPGPGPAGYKPDPKYTHHGRDGGPYAFATWRPKDPLEKKTPGPTDYDTSVKGNVWSKLRNAPASSLASREKGPRLSSGPGPSAYNVNKQVMNMTTHRSPEAILSGRYPDPLRNKNPGPGTYLDSDMNRYKKGTPPSYSLASKHPHLDKSLTPSPLAYRPEPGYVKTGKMAPSFSFGNHHSRFSSAVLTREDADGDCDVCVADDYCRDTAPPKPDDCPPVKCT